MKNKVCPIHGKQTGVVETSVEVFETLGFGRCNPDFLPRLLIFNLTGSCNTQCDFCYNPLKGVNMTAIEVVDIARLFPGWEIVLTVCSAPSLSAFDIDHIQQAPFMLANDGEIYSTPHTLLINEGIEKGIIKCYAPHLNLNTQD